MQWTGDIDRGSWIGPRMSGWASRDSVLPGGFPGYVRIFHPGRRYRWDGPVNRPGSTVLSDSPISWFEVAALTGRTAHPWMQWGSIAGVQTQEADLGDGNSVHPPEDGRLPRHVLEALLPLLAAATRTPEDVTATVWNGWGELRSVTSLTWSSSGDTTSGRMTGEELGVAPDVTRALDHGPVLRLPGRDHLLLAGALADLADPAWAVHAGLGRGSGDDGVAAPQLLWPADHAWCLATEIDFGFTVLGGAPALIDRVVAADGIEALPLDHDGDLSWNGDAVNPLAADRR